MATLKRANVQVETKAAAAAKNVKPRCKIGGDVVDRYVKANDALKAAKAILLETEAPVKAAGVELVIETNLSCPTNPVTSVEVTDETGAVAQIQFKDVYGNVDAEVVSAIFDTLQDDKHNPLDINQFVHETVVAKFDSKVFLDAKGEFVPDRYAAFKEAIDKVAATFGIASPLSSSSLVTAKENFHSVRWSIPGKAQQLAIQGVLPASVAGRKVCEGTKPLVKASPVVAEQVAQVLASVEAASI